MSRLLDALARLLGLNHHRWSIDAEDVLEQMPVALLAIDDSDQVRFANRRACKTFGQTREELVGSQAMHLLPTAFEHNSPPEDAGTATVKADDYGCRKDGAKFPARLYLRKLESAEINLTLIAVEDLTRERELERIKEEFLAMLSHDLRNPLTSISADVFMLRQGIYGKLPEEANATLEATEETVQRLIRLIQHLLSVEKFASGTFEMDLKPTAIEQVISSALASISATADERNVSFRFETAHVGDVRVLEDGDRIVQVLVNLMSNAIKYSPESGVIKVRCDVDEHFMRISVSDQGPGVPAGKQKMIFEKYKQSDPVSDTKSGGIGLGLAICKSIVEEHGGSIGVIASPGTGSQFWFTLPLYQGKAAEGES